MFENLKIRRKIKLIEQEIKFNELASIKTLLENRDPAAASRRSLEDKDESSWTPFGGRSSSSLDTHDSALIRDQATKFYYKNCHARNIIRLFEKYITGRGFNVIPNSTLGQVKDYWESFWQLNNMEKRKKEMSRRMMRDGEFFLRFFEKPQNELVIRFLDPDGVVNPENNSNKYISHGIETDPGDVETVVNYWYKGISIPAEQIEHVKILVDSDVKRGRSFLEPMLSKLSMYNDWTIDRMKLNKVRAAVGMVKIIDGSTTQAANIAAAANTTQQQTPSGNYLSKAPEGVSIFTTNRGVDYKFMTPNLNAADVQHDGNMFLQSIAAGAGLPDYMITSDSSNSNFAAVLVAEAPGVREFQDWQDFFGIAVNEIFAKVISYGIKVGAIPQSEVVEFKDTTIDPVTRGKKETYQTKVVKTNITAEIEFPELVHRDIKTETEAYIAQSNQGWISDQTASSRLDLKFDVEQERIREKETEEPGETEPEDKQAKAEIDQQLAL